MRRCLPGLILLFVVSVGNAQSLYKPLRVELGMGTYGVPLPFFTFPIFYFEPSYTFKDRLKLGVRFEATIRPGPVAVGSMEPTIDYYYSIGKRDFRLFAGAGAGVCGVSYYGYYYAAHVRTPSLASMVRLGFEGGHLRVSAEYNFIPNSLKSIYDMNGNLTYTEFRPNRYFGLKVGVTLGGGKRNYKYPVCRPCVEAARRLLQRTEAKQ